jgi:6-phosphogluconolactonase (cycloisomerase 2 family)
VLTEAALSFLGVGVPPYVASWGNVLSEFAIDPKGRFLLAAGEKSPTISVYAIEQPSVALRLLQEYPAGKGANWVEIVSTD